MIDKAFNLAKEKKIGNENKKQDKEFLV